MNSLHTRIGNGLVRILRWSERYTGTDMVYLARGSGWLGVSQLSASIGAFISMYVLANALSPEVFGEYRFFMASFLILSIFALPGMRIALLESTPKNFRNNLIVAYREMVRFGVAGSVVSVGIAFYYVLNNNLALALGFLCIAILLPFFDSSSAFLEYLKALKEFRKVAVYTLIVRTILLALTTSVALLYPKYGWLIFLSFLIGNIAPNLYLHWRTTRRFAGPEETSDPKLTHYAKHLTALAVLGLLAMQLDKIFVWKFIGAEELAIFFIAYTLPQELGRFLQIIPQLAFPKFAIATPSLITKTLLPKIWIYLGSICILICIYIILCPYIFTLLFPQYSEAIVYSQILATSIVVFAFSPIKTYLITQKRTRALYALSTIPPLIRIVSSVILIAFFGIFGAICAILIESLIVSVMLLIFFLYFEKIRPDTYGEQ